MILYCHIGNRGLFRWSGLQTLQKSNDGFVSYIFVSYISYPDHHHTTFMIQVHCHNKQICSSVKILQKLIFHARRVQSSHFWSIIIMCWHIFTKSKKIWESDEKESGRVYIQYIVSARKVKPWSTFCTLPPILHSREIISKNLLFQMFCSLIPLIIFLCTMQGWGHQIFVYKEL